MKKILVLLAIIFFSLETVNPQDKIYWKNAQPGEIKIFSISFMDHSNGKAVTPDGGMFITSDAGLTWINNSTGSAADSENTLESFWSAEVYCSVMKTTDSGKTWFPYGKEKQDHFCGVYLKDENSGYKIAGNFLNKVTEKIISSCEKNEIDLLINQPHQCTEYYLNADEGWALGWCIKNFKSISN